MSGRREEKGCEQPHRSLGLGTPAATVVLVDGKADKERVGTGASRAKVSM